MQQYLESSEYINWDHPSVLALAAQLAAGTTDKEAVVRRCFEFVRDEIRHCTDSYDEALTAKASDVLKEATGFCYAKSHLLAALLRANNIPAALCYQRLNGDTGPTLHGLNAVHLDNVGWYRIDPRGNKAGVNAQFTPPVEQLAFTLEEGEEDVAGLWSRPACSVVRALTNYRDVTTARSHLPAVAE